MQMRQKGISKKMWYEHRERDSGSSVEFLTKYIGPLRIQQCFHWREREREREIKGNAEGGVEMKGEGQWANVHSCSNYRGEFTAFELQRPPPLKKWKQDTSTCHWSVGSRRRQSERESVFSSAMKLGHHCETRSEARELSTSKSSAEGWVGGW